VYFPNPPFQFPPQPSKLTPHPADGSPHPTNKIDNAAVAVAHNGIYPPVDQSYVAFLWFAFTPPIPQHDGTNEMLLQIWDDGNRLIRRFRRASWTQLGRPPNLISNATFLWAGKQRSPDGSLVGIPVSDVSSPGDVAGQYQVSLVTNIDGFAFPIQFALTRFMTKRNAAGQQKISSTVVASVVAASIVDSKARLPMVFPKRTLVADYRLSVGELRGTPLTYLVDTNAPPGVEQIRQSDLYKRAAEGVKANEGPPHWKTLMLLLLAVLLVIPAVLRRIPPRI
jgi:hypothetical protein